MVLIHKKSRLKNVFFLKNIYPQGILVMQNSSDNSRNCTFLLKKLHILEIINIFAPP